MATGSEEEGRGRGGGGHVAEGAGEEVPVLGRVRLVVDEVGAAEAGEAEAAAAAAALLRGGRGRAREEGEDRVAEGAGLTVQ